MCVNPTVTSFYDIIAIAIQNIKYKQFECETF